MKHKNHEDGGREFIAKEVGFMVDHLCLFCGFELADIARVMAEKAEELEEWARQEQEDWCEAHDS